MSKFRLKLNTLNSKELKTKIGYLEYLLSLEIFKFKQIIGFYLKA
ncbi:hypothetical protein NSTC745_03859 [Nostoc sp. DSM 114161]|jgi:hypothetical protein